jgi:hypothetical protein
MEKLSDLLNKSVATALVYGWRRQIGVQKFLDGKLDEEKGFALIDKWCEETLNEYENDLQYKYSGLVQSSYGVHNGHDLEEIINERKKKFENCKTYEDKARFLLKYGR